MMEPQNNTHLAKSLLIIIAVFISGGVIGIAADPYLPSALSNAKKGYDTGFAAARKVVEDSTLGNFFKTPDDVRFLYGAVTSASSTSFVIHTRESNPFEDSTLSDRIVMVTADTKIFKLVSKDAKTYQAELAAYEKSVAAGGSGTTIPSPSVKVVADMNSITIGSKLLVIALENIKETKEFVASEIQIERSLPAR